MDLYAIKVLSESTWKTLEPTYTFVFEIAQRNLRCVQFQYRHLPKVYIKIGKVGGQVKQIS
jgi:hypothetical protein